MMMIYFAHLTTRSNLPYNYPLFSCDHMIGANAQTFTPQAFDKSVIRSNPVMIPALFLLASTCPSGKKLSASLAAPNVSVAMLIHCASLLSRHQRSRDFCSSGSMTHQYMIPTLKPKAGSTKVCGKSINAPESGRTETISAIERITAMVTSPATANDTTHPPEPEIPITWPESTNSPCPIVPLKAIAVRDA